MFTIDDINNIKNEKLFKNELKVKRVGKDVFKIIGYHYGSEQIKMIDQAENIAKFLNGYFGLN